LAREPHQVPVRGVDDLQALGHCKRNRLKNIASDDRIAVVLAGSLLA
jgi:hypothetical protein